MEYSLLLLESLSKINQQWLRPLGDFLAQWKRLKLSERGQMNKWIGPEPTPEQRKENEELLDVLFATQASEELKQGVVKLRELEDTIDDIAWNAIVIQHPDRFQDMQETASYCTQLASKLTVKKFLPSESIPYAKTLLAGLLRFLWDSQNRAYLQKEFVEGSAQTLIEAIDDIRKNWAPPTIEGWFDIIRNFPQDVDDMLNFLKGLTWEELYKHLDKRRVILQNHAKALLERVQQKYPEALARSAAYIMGTLIEKNTFSPLEGSVPEAKGKRLEDIYVNISLDAESYFYPYLWKGFNKVRNREPDELVRWRTSDYNN